MQGRRTASPLVLGYQGWVRRLLFESISRRSGCAPPGEASSSAWAGHHYRHVAVRNQNHNLRNMSTDHLGRHMYNRLSGETVRLPPAFPIS